MLRPLALLLPRYCLAVLQLPLARYCFPLPNFLPSERSYYEQNRACLPCGAGLFNPSSGQTDGSCQPCPRGEYAGSSGSATCTPCAPGSFMPAQGATACNLCDADTFNPDSGATKNRACTPCADGLSSGPGSSVCQDATADIYFFNLYSVDGVNRISAYSKHDGVPEEFHPAAMGPPLQVSSAPSERPMSAASAFSTKRVTRAQ